MLNGEYDVNQQLKNKENLQIFVFSLKSFIKMKPNLSLNTGNI